MARILAWGSALPRLIERIEEELAAEVVPVHTATGRKVVIVDHGHIDILASEKLAALVLAELAEAGVPATPD